ncbi:STAS domain-containing protein [Paractinoplanes ferrugineus]|uniref:STAS domain-containing protein n=1 Tax=Paractinoplanes ferrugineus TaxID=113564 RepID=UPI0031D88F6A
MTDQRIPEAVVIVTEPFDGFAVDRWRRIINEAVELAPRRLTVDLRASPLVDAAAIALLLSAHRRMISQGGRLVLAAPTTRVRRILQLARLEHVFEVVESAGAEGVDQPRHADHAEVAAGVVGAQQWPGPVRAGDGSFGGVAR